MHITPSQLYIFIEWRRIWMPMIKGCNIVCLRSYKHHNVNLKKIYTLTLISIKTVELDWSTRAQLWICFENTFFIFNSDSHHLQK